ncbi:MAG TPA: hypothetical protein VJ813_15340 [Vicinamibacterales bacterium]|nr:hypothetical protein [Vicinamibacterales bacterium]
MDCSYCHSAPPRLNERGLRFVAAGYRFGSEERSSTIPLAIWNTVDLEWRHSADLVKGFPSRVELISAGPIGRSRLAYFAEWRALSQSIGGNGRLLDRSGRFEDLFVRAPLTPGGALSVTAGQFRTLTQVDVSLRLSLSEPLVFSSSVPGRRAAGARLTSLRAFSPSGRQPSVRVEYQAARGQSAADGWFAAATLPLTGELTIPFSDAASFEFEGRPKGVFLEVFRRSGLTTVGGHGFIGNERRRVVSAVVTHDLGNRFALLAGVGAFHAAGVTDTRFSLGGEATISSRAAAGIRVDHRTGQGRDPAVLLYGNGHIPFGPASFRQALRLQIEHRIQPANHATGFALSHVF